MFDLSNEDELKNLTKEQLLSDDLVEQLFLLEDAVVREKKITAFETQAVKLRCKTDFNNRIKAKREEIKKARQELREKQLAVRYQFTPPGTNKTYQTGQWRVNSEGINRLGANDSYIRASFYPVIIEKILIPFETSNKQRIMLRWFKKEAEGTVCADREEIATKAKIVRLSNYGLPVTDITARNLVSYLEDFEYLNSEQIKRETFSSKYGWHRSGKELCFVPYSENILFDGTNAERVAQAVETHGNLEKWKETVRKVRRSGRQEPLVFMAAAFASALVGLLNEQSFIVNLYGETGRGKTVCMKLAASVWGDPARYISESNSSLPSLEHTQGLLNHLPLMLDDLSKVQWKGQDKRRTLSNVIYNLTASGRGLQNQDGTARTVPTWQNITLTNMERPLTDGGMQGGAINRVLDFEIEDGNIFQNVPELLSSINENYGLAGKVFIETLLEAKDSLIHDLSKRIEDSEAELKRALSAAGVQKTDKQIKPLAIIFVADKLIDDLLFEDGIHINQRYGIDTLKNADEVSEGARAYRELIGMYELEYAKFSTASGVYDGYEWGYSEKDLVYFKSTAFRNIVEGQGFNASQLLQWLDTQGLLIKNSKSGYTCKKTFNGERFTCYCVRIRSEDTGSQNEKVIDLPERAAAPEEIEEPLPFDMPV